MRLWAPARTPRIHVNGHWVPDGPILTTWKPGDPFVIAAWEETGVTELYVDIVREVTVTPTRFAYLDVYVDVMLREGKVRSKDEELLANLTADEAVRVLAIRDDLLSAMSQGKPPFRLTDPRWQVGTDARALAPGIEVAL